MSSFTLVNNNPSADILFLSSKSDQQIIHIWQACHMKCQHESPEETARRFNIWLTCCRELRERGYTLNAEGNQWLAYETVSP